MAPARSSPLRLHWNVMGNAPTAATLSVVPPPTASMAPCGWVVIAGPTAETVSTAALLVADAVPTLAEGVEEAAETIDRGLANALLNCWIAYQ